jgi:hypothetical protein
MRTGMTRQINEMRCRILLWLREKPSATWEPSRAILRQGGDVLVATTPSLCQGGGHAVATTPSLSQGEGRAVATTPSLSHVGGGGGTTIYYSEDGRKVFSAAQRFPLLPPPCPAAAQLRGAAEKG